MNTISKFSENYFWKIIFLGNDSRVGTPVPIPNTEVKHSNAEDSGSENRKLPRIFFCIKKNLTAKDKSFFVILLIAVVVDEYIISVKWSGWLFREQIKRKH